MNELKKKNLDNLLTSATMLARTLATENQQEKLKLLMRGLQSAMVLIRSELEKDQLKQ